VTLAVRAASWVVGYLGAVLSAAGLRGDRREPSRPRVLDQLLGGARLRRAGDRAFPLSYEAWHVVHAVLALVLVIGALGHVLFVDEHVSSRWKQIPSCM
jgi:hypothetical protein